MPRNTPAGDAPSAPLFILFGGMVLSNLGMIPYSAPLYGDISSILVPVAIPLLLLRADLQKVFRETGAMLIAFGVAVILTVIGALSAQP